ncbi:MULTISPECIES: V-type ATP synthase subunit F [unclassified Desulfurobacterium]|uniref:V-type ATP synthase subunit F n=1 Tax=Desulfurobacterium sp. TC5-1 TaxID=1158318 RepID=UPI0003B3D59C|nr:V-type ATP synthase subunit F [Desulfurobacterium sp. TC5-1]
MKIVFVGTEDECTGFKLAGLETAVAEDEASFRTVASEIITNPEVAVLVVSERFADAFDRELKKKLGKKALPAVVFVPSIDGTTSKQSLKEFLASVLGVRLQ